MCRFVGKSCKLANGNEKSPFEYADRQHFIAFCIEQYKTAKGLQGEDVAKLFFDKGVDNYLSDNYEVLHTQSHQWLVEEIDEYLNRQGK